MVEVEGQLARDDWSDDDLFAIVRGRGTAPGGSLDQRRALEILFERYHARVHGQCSRILGDDQLADDATQEIFLSLLEKPVRYEGRQHFGSWLYVVTRNHCLNARRGRQREVMSEDVDEVWAAALVDPADPGRELHDNELAAIIARTCDEELNTREQEVIHLRYFWGLRVKEINRILGLENTSGARTHLATAHRKLRDVLRSKFGEDVLRTILDEA